MTRFLKFNPKKCFRAIEQVSRSEEKLEVMCAFNAIAIKKEITPVNTQKWIGEFIQLQWEIDDVLIKEQEKANNENEENRLVNEEEEEDYSRDGEEECLEAYGEEDDLELFSG